RCRSSACSAAACWSPLCQPRRSRQGSAYSWWGSWAGGGGCGWRRDDGSAERSRGREHRCRGRRGCRRGAGCPGAVLHRAVRTRAGRDPMDHVRHQRGRVPADRDGGRHPRASVGGAMGASVHRGRGARWLHDVLRGRRRDPATAPGRAGLDGPDVLGGHGRRRARRYGRRDGGRAAGAAMSELVWVCLGAAIGAPARYLLDRAVQSRHQTGMPWGTVTVNLIGALLLGFLLGMDIAPGLQIGLCGTFTTYSTFSLATVRLLEERAYARALWVVGVHLVVGLGAASLGWVGGRALA